MTSEVIENEEVSAGIFRLTLAADSFPETAAPGQFIMVRTSDGVDPLLRRAFSIHDLMDRRIRILYKVVGRGTGWLARRKKRDRIDLIGPLGTGFSVPKTVKTAWLVAGGIGVAPFQMLIRILRSKHIDTTLFFGAGTGNELVGLRDFEEQGIPQVLATEDGSAGEQGMIVEVFRKRIQLALGLPGKAKIDRSCRVYACGPQPMLLAVARLCRDSGVQGEVSMESEMGCGIGTCMGCVVRTSRGYERVCREGPVFPADSILWE